MEEKLNPVEQEFLEMLQRNDPMTDIGVGTQGEVKKIRLKNGVFYAVKAYSNENEAKKKSTYEHESKVTSYIAKQCQDYLVCFSGSVVYNHHGVNQYWLITKFLEGYEELFKLLYEKPPSPISFWLKDNRENPNINIYIDMIKGLSLLHKGLNVSHHDIKPENVMVNYKTSQIKYIDFGLACMESSVCVPVGSYNYMPPEILQIKSLEAAKNGDLWSLGCVILVSEYGALPIDDAEKYIVNKTLRPERLRLIEEFVRSLDASPERFIERDGYKIDLTKLLNMDPSQRTLECYEETRQ